MYLEKLLKKDDVKLTIWERNVQMAFYSWVVISVICMYDYIDFGAVDANGISVQARTPFQGWNYLTCFIAFLQALGGILVAATLKYADALVKNFSIAGSIMLSTIIGHFYLGGSVDMFVCIGCVCTIIAIFNYALDTSLPPTAAPPNISTNVNNVPVKSDK